MAEAIGIASGVVGLGTFAFKASVKLSDAIKEFKHHPKRVRQLLEELDHLIEVLRWLNETVSTITDVNLDALELPVRRCGEACKDFRLGLERCLSESGSTRASFQDWTRLRYMGDDILSFQEMLGRYKSTINIVLIVATL
jgi:hypothetical protein